MFAKIKYQLYILLFGSPHSSKSPSNQLQPFGVKFKGQQTISLQNFYATQNNYFWYIFIFEREKFYVSTQFYICTHKINCIRCFTFGRYLNVQRRSIFVNVYLHQLYAIYLSAFAKLSQIHLKLFEFISTTPLKYLSLVSIWNIIIELLVTRDQWSLFIIYY